MSVKTQVSTSADPQLLRDRAIATANGAAAMDEGKWPLASGI
jgi:hypothetical protein